MSAPSLRRRVRAEMIDEIKAVARRHLAADGANLSLRAVARDMGMVSSAVYRYFASRDDLLTALIIDAYSAIGDAVERADAACPRDDYRGRLLGVARAAREWALANPAEYALIFGSPVPGYSAPEATIQPASRQPIVIAAVVQDAHLAGALVDRMPDRHDAEPPEPTRSELRSIAAQVALDVPPLSLSRAMLAWVQIYGMISFELFGQFANSIHDRAGFFDHQMHLVADLVGLP